MTRTHLSNSRIEVMLLFFECHTQNSMKLVGENEFNLARNKNICLNVGNVNGFKDWFGSFDC